jgi:hypothetical protein
MIDDIYSKGELYAVASPREAGMKMLLLGEVYHVDIRTARVELFFKSKGIQAHVRVSHRHDTALFTIRGQVQCQVFTKLIESNPTAAKPLVLVPLQQYWKERCWVAQRWQLSFLAQSGKQLPRRPYRGKTNWVRNQPLLY